MIVIAFYFIFLSFWRPSRQFLLHLPISLSLQILLLNKCEDNKIENHWVASLKAKLLKEYDSPINGVTDLKHSTKYYFYSTL